MADREQEGREPRLESTVSDKPKHPAQRGRPPIKNPASERFELRLTKVQRAKLEKLGGAAWLKSKIDAA